MKKVFKQILFLILVGLFVFPLVARADETIISDVSIEGVEVPVLGNHPDFTYSVPEGANYTISYNLNGGTLTTPNPITLAATGDEPSSFSSSGFWATGFWAAGFWV